MKKPIINLKGTHIHTNAAGLRALDGVSYAQVLIAPSKKLLVVMPCHPEARHAVRLRSAGKYPNRPKHVRCDDLIAKIARMMDWQGDCVRAVQGEVAVIEGEAIIVFNLESANG